MAHYQAKFNLAYPVTDMEEAQAYLLRDDMAEILRSDEYMPVGLREATASLEWNLADDISGTIDLITQGDASQADLESLSRWVKGQCSDGLGEGFEQQGFANYVDTDELDEHLQDYYAFDMDDPDMVEPSEEDYWCQASFDWRTNDYPFVQVG